MNRKLFSVISVMFLAGSLIVPVSGAMNPGAIRARSSSSIEMASVSAASTTVHLLATGNLTAGVQSPKTHRYKYYLSIKATNNWVNPLTPSTVLFWSVPGYSGQTTVSALGYDLVGVTQGEWFTVVNHRLITVADEIPASGPFLVWFNVPTIVSSPATGSITTHVFPSANKQASVHPDYQSDEQYGKGPCDGGRIHWAVGNFQDERTLSF